MPPKRKPKSFASLHIILKVELDRLIASKRKLTKKQFHGLINKLNRLSKAGVYAYFRHPDHPKMKPIGAIMHADKVKLNALKRKLSVLGRRSGFGLAKK